MVTLWNLGKRCSSAENQVTDGQVTIFDITNQDKPLISDAASARRRARKNKHGGVNEFWSDEEF